MINSEEMKRIEEEATEAGIRPELMMENAGRGLVDALSERADPKGKKVAVVCGTGNNGGDGFVVARHLLCEGASVHVFIYGGEDRVGSEESRMNLRMLKNLGVKVKDITEEEDIPDFSGYGIVVDAVLGIGLKGELRGFLPELVEAMNRADGYRVAVDVPTGLQSDTGEVMGAAFEADLTVTFHDMKPGLEEDVCGEVVVRGIGVPGKV